MSQNNSNNENQGTSEQRNENDNSTNSSTPHSPSPAPPPSLIPNFPPILQRQGTQLSEILDLIETLRPPGTNVVGDRRNWDVTVAAFRRLLQENAVRLGTTSTTPSTPAGQATTTTANREVRTDKGEEKYEASSPRRSSGNARKH